jgi:hypothetical protein
MNWVWFLLFYYPKQIKTVPNVAFGSKYSQDDNKYIDKLTIDKLQLKFNINTFDNVGSCLNVDITSGITKMFI